MFLGAFTAINSAQAGTLYLPLKMSPEIESRVERLFVLANMPIIKRPIAINRVNVALEKVGNSEPALTRSISEYLKRYSKTISVTHFEAKAAAYEGEGLWVPNARGVGVSSGYDVSFAGFWAMNSFMSLSVGGKAYERDRGRKSEFPEGTYLSIGGDYLQMDIGNRAHWFGPFQESDMLISTQAPSMTSVTFSNSEPIPLFGTSYEIFWAQMSESAFVLDQNGVCRCNDGKPKLFGFHISFAPVDGFAIGFNRLMQYGGADRDEGMGSLAQAFFDAKKYDNVGVEGNNFGNQLSSVTTRYTFTGDFPVSVYMEYAGEDTSASSDAHLGNSALMFGFHLPKLTNQLDFTYEYAEWQNAWYVNTIYGDGLTHNSSVLGHWGAQQRVFGDAVGAEAQTFKLIWDIAIGKQLTAIYRQIDNTDFTNEEYETGQSIGLDYSVGMGAFIVGGELLAGKDVFGEDYGKVSAFLRW